MDGTTNEEGCGVGLILMSPELEHIPMEYIIHLSFKATNNEAEYEALLVGLHLTKTLGVTRIHIYNDSQLIIRQVTKEYQAKGVRMKAYLEKVRVLLSTIEQWTLMQVLRKENEEADLLVKMASASPMNITRYILVGLLFKPKIQVAEVLLVEVPNKST